MRTIEEIKRFTTDDPQTNFENMMNYCYAEDNMAKIRWAEEKEAVPLHKLAASFCRVRGCKKTADEIMEDGIECNCPIAIMYNCGAQAAENNARLKMHEDICEGIPLDRLEEICAAEKDGRCVVPPCKVGDKVYLIVHGYVEETKVRTFFVGHPSYNRGEPDPRYEMIRCTNYDLPMKDFGKTVFLTHEAAEKALEGLK